MRPIYLILIIYLSSIVDIYSDVTAISFESASDGYTLSEDKSIVTITAEGTYELTGSQTDKKILVSSSCTLNLNEFSLTNIGALTPIVISENKAVELVLPSDKESMLIDSETNENDGVIYLQSGASLTISGTGILTLNPKKLLAINGTEGTSLTVNDGAKIKIISGSSTGGIYLRNSITFNYAEFQYYGENGAHHAIDSEGNIKLIKGDYYLKSGNGKGIQSEKVLDIGKENGNSNDVTLYIETSNEGIEAKGINIYLGSIEIIAKEDGINAASSGNECDENVQCSGNCECYINIKGGMLQITSGEDGLDANGDIFISGGMVLVFASSTGADQPIDQDGILKITGGLVAAAGSSSMGGVNAQTTQIAKIYKGTINSKANINITNEIGIEIYSFQAPKEASYIYFNYETSFKVELNGNEITLSETNQNQQPNNPEKEKGGNPPDKGVEPNFGYFLRLPNIVFLYGIIL